MVTSPGNALQAHFGRYTTALYIVMAALTVGLLFGVLATGTLTEGDRLVLLDYLRKFLALEVSQPHYGMVFSLALVNNLKMIGLLYLLGVSVAGMPVVVLLVFLRGFMIGFSASFVVTAMHWPGVLVGVITMGMDNLFLIPALLLVSAVSMGFSWQLIRPRLRDGSLGRSFAFYTGLVAVMAAVTLFGTVLEAYGAPLLMHVLSRWGI